MFYTYIGLTSESRAPWWLDAKMLEEALRGLERAVTEWEARGGLEAEP